MARREMIVEESAAVSQEERRWIDVRRQEELLGKLLNHSLTAEEWLRYEKERARFGDFSGRLATLLTTATAAWCADASS